ncbi:MAG: membrane protein insertase YidC [Gemmatimonadetes bacterium]|nr:membrane protein insertase YidC [Gemmatimonadota bacterium]MYA64394.1 membrane protein insertase YidC [Gemmatimonadota bacterium]MYB98631.1 membrane protein insertase YidC [Gemmatimonadota bacterium]MYH54101.1 membrane protein insertase YidC [Gemmatimonadota bacterium]MYI47394.1 membrane protein insertase YidC [Gemmatimonadota bacterium]
MNTGLRFGLAMLLMLAVILATNLLFPPVVPDPPPAEPGPAEVSPDEIDLEPGVVEPPRDEIGLPGGGDERRETLVTVETPLYTITFSNQGAAARSIRLTQHRSFARDGAVELVPVGTRRVLAGTWQVGTDQVDLTRAAYEITPADGIRLSEGAGPRTLTFRYQHPTQPFVSEIRYTFSADSYVVTVEGQLPARERASLFVDLGIGPAINELKEVDDRRAMAYSGNHVEEGVSTRPLGRVRETEVMDGPLRWGAVKSKYFVEAILPGTGTGERGFLAGVWADPVQERDRAAVRVGMPITTDGSYAYRLYLGPIEPELLRAVGDDLEEVNPIGWAFLRPIVRPFVGVIHWTVNTLHDQFRLGYAWVLIVIGILVRILLWPLNQKAMRSQMKMQAIQPLAMDIREKFSQDPQKMQQETMKLYREHKVNPLGGCLPMLIPWPVLIALFFVFQNTIQLRGVPFLWLPDLSAPDPFFILPLFLGASMFLLQFISMRAMAAVSPQMKMMMYVLPIFMVVIFWRLASGLNLYYAAFNVATIPQQILIARERKKAAPGMAPKKRG